MKNVAKKIHDVMRDVIGVTKTANIGYYKAVEHDEVTKVLRNAMLEHGLAAIPTVVSSQVTMINSSFRSDAVVEVLFIDLLSGETLSTRSFAYSIDSGDKGAGKAISMATKYAYLKTFMLESFDNEESRKNEEKLIFTAEKSSEDQVSMFLQLLKDSGKETTVKTAEYARGLTKVEINAAIEQLKP